MAAFCDAVLTTQGNSLLIDAAAGQKIEFTRLATGCGEYDGTEELRAMEALKEERQSFAFTRYEKVSETSVLLTAVISNEGLMLGYRMTEIGVYGRLEGEQGEVLCSVAVIGNREEADFWPPWNGLAPMEIVQRYYITISPEAVPVITVDHGSVLAEIAAESVRAQSAEGQLNEKIEEEEARAAGEEGHLRRLVEAGMADLTEAIGEEARRAAERETQLDSRKVDKVEGKQLSSNDYTSVEMDKVNVAYDKSHSHENRSILETISEELLRKWNSAVEHITDTLKHVTEGEREKWDDAWGKRHSHSNAGVLGKITQAMLDKLEGIAEGANHYAHPTGAGYKHIPSGGSSGQILRWGADGIAQWGNDNNTTYSAGNQITIENGAVKIKNICTSVTDWNTAITNGWYMGRSAANAPITDSSIWFFGLVIAHNDKHVRQILYRFASDSNVAGANCDRYERAMHNGTWGNWINTSVHVAVPANAKFTDTTYNIANNDTTTADGYIADARIVRTHGSEIDEINNNLRVYWGETGYTDLSLQAALTKYLTFSNVPIRESRNFFLNTKEGYYTGNASAWNGDWISGFIVRGSANINSIDAYYFTRFVSQGADTVLKKLGSGALKVVKVANFGGSTNNQTFNCTNIPNYKNLTVDNFAHITTYAWGGTYGTRHANFEIHPSLSYNASTGILTLSPTVSKNDYNDQVYVSGYINCYYVNAG